MTKANGRQLQPVPRFGLPPVYGKATPQGLQLRKDLTEAAWREVGRRLARAQSVISWWIGDWWAYGNHHYGDRTKLTKAPDWQGPSYSTCANYAWVCKRFKLSRRRENLSFGHHEAVLILPDDEADELLDWAAAPLREKPPRPPVSVAVLRKVAYQRHMQDETERPVKRKTPPFIIWGVDNHVGLMQGSCQEVLKLGPDESVDLFLTSPPYDKMRDYDTEWTIDLPAVGKEVYRMLKPGGVAVLVMQDETRQSAKSLTTFRTILNWCDEAGLKLFETLIYYRHAAPGKHWDGRFRVDHEYMAVLLKGDRPKHVNHSCLRVPSKDPGKVVPAGTVRRQRSGKTKHGPPVVTGDDADRGTVWKYGNGFGGNSALAKLRREHPASFPTKLARDHILCWTKEGDTVMDPFVGSGTTVAMALEENRRAWGIDISSSYLWTTKMWCEEILREQGKLTEDTTIYAAERN